MLKGINCPGGKKILIDDMSKRCGNCPAPCLPLPLILALVSKNLFEPGKYHITELTNATLRISYLRRKYDYYVQLERLVDMALGTAFHLLISSNRAGLDSLFSFEEENHFEESFGDFSITGTPDLYDKKRKILYDHKIVKQSKAEHLLKSIEDSDYTFQLNAYRIFKFPEAKELRLNLIIKDFSPRKTKLPSAVFTLNVPLLPEPLVRSIIIGRAEALHSFLKNNIAPAMCSKEETWNGLRCNYYCDVVALCHQEFLKQKENNNV